MGPRSASIWRDASLAGREVAHVPLVDIDASDLVEALGRLVVRVVVRRHLAAVILQREGNRAADAPRSACHQCDPIHSLSPGNAQRRRDPTPRRRARLICAGGSAFSSVGAENRGYAAAWSAIHAASRRQSRRLVRGLAIIPIWPSGGRQVST